MSFSFVHGCHIFDQVGNCVLIAYFYSPSLSKITTSLPAIYWYVLVRSWRLCSWRRSRCNCYSSILINFVSKVMTCNRSTVVSLWELPQMVKLAKLLILLIFDLDLCHFLYCHCCSCRLDSELFLGVRQYQLL